MDMDQELRRRVVMAVTDLATEIDRTTPTGKAVHASIEAMLMAMDAYMAAGSQPDPWEGTEPAKPGEAF